MKINEILLIGGALLATLVLSKGRAASSVLQNAAIPLLSNENQNQKEIRTVIVKPPQFTRIDITEQLRNISSLELEKNLTPLQNQINETRNYISSQQKYMPPNNFSEIAPPNWTGINLLEKFDRDSDPNRSLFPDFRLLYTQENRNIIAQQAQYENTQSNIGKAKEYATRQQGKIDLLIEEYQTRFGGLSRYG
jgi:hypothetical protein|tara:strand:- start:466 stop:1044 length:579 start_codon:yes stop_codon:yes gene_type:complete